VFELWIVHRSMNHRIHIFVVYVDYFSKIPPSTPKNGLNHKLQLLQIPRLASKTTSGQNRHNFSLAPRESSPTLGSSVPCRFRPYLSGGRGREKPNRPPASRVHGGRVLPLRARPSAPPSGKLKPIAEQHVRKEDMSKARACDHGEVAPRLHRAVHQRQPPGAGRERNCGDCGDRGVSNQPIDPAPEDCIS
jgi:hypothetical protein